MTSFYEEMAADALADRDPIDCRECCSTGETGDGSLCPYCDGTGMWNGRAI